jgi:predicted RNA-binding protein YlxR (DUF448 family)
MRPKRELVRVVRMPSGEVRVDATGKVSGRGAYVCRRPECADQAVTQGRLQHALDVMMPSTVADDLRLAIARLSGES